MKLVGLLILLLISSSLRAEGTTHLSWIQEPYRVDGLAFSPEEILEFTIHYGVTSGEYIYIQPVPPNEREFLLTVPTSGIWYIVMSVTSTEMETSFFSNEIVREINPTRRPKPMIITLTLVQND